MKRWVVAVLALVGLLAGGWTALARFPLDLPDPVAAVVHLPERLMTRWIPPRKGKVRRLTPEEREAFRALTDRLDRLDARVVWSSNRDGNHELYLMDLRSREVRRLTRHPHVDFFSRFSPDGQQIVFLRSQRPWVSFRDERSWDVYLLDLETGEERLLAKAGYHPSWTPDGKAIIFARGPQIIHLDLATRRESIFLDGTAVDWMRGDLTTPELSPDGRQLAVTVRSRLYDGVAMVDLASGRASQFTAGQACQLTWGPEQDPVWVDTGGRGGTRIMTLPAGGGEPTIFMDLPGRHSHEYFPKLSSDGRWLVWGATDQGHEHDRAPYEIFLWEVGTPWETAVRLTYHTGNDQWPDIYVR